MKLRALILAALLAGVVSGQAVPLQKAVALAPATMYLNPDKTSAQVGSVRPGMEIGEQSASGAFVQVFANGVSGWIQNQDLAAYGDPESPELIFGAAADLEHEAENSGGERQAAMDAARLYYTIYSDFPASARAAEALYRAADVVWQVKLGEEPKRRTPNERQFPDDAELRRVVGKFPGTPWAARAAYDLLIEHFTCGDWNDKPECALKEAGTYQDYVKKYPRGPMAAEAAYDAVYREGIAWTLYKPRDAGKASELERAVARDAAALRANYSGTDWAAEAALVAYHVAHGVALTVPTVTPLGGP
ncbi:MAG TPA: hypothetical protein VN709_01210 [Terriglobales bacterium]|nr:hypothetical protein [Terriglobales bacterium]